MVALKDLLMSQFYVIPCMPSNGQKSPEAYPFIKVLANDDKYYLSTPTPWVILRQIQ